MKLDKTTVQQFQKTVWGYYSRHGRHDLPWRQPEPDGSFDPYKILVSEIMLQQTQVTRVIPKYHEFLKTFPTIQTLVEAELGQVLRVWNGLGYNRRAKYLHETAKQISFQHARSFAQDITQLVKLPGVGKNTGGAIVAYAFNQPAIFVETNIRTVYIYQFFQGQTNVSDAQIVELLEQTIDMSSPRTFYWALMDYGSYLKPKVGNLNKLSKSYIKQSAFHGSDRQLRGAILRTLSTNPQTERKLMRELRDERLHNVLAILQKEGLVQKTKLSYHL